MVSEWIATDHVIKTKGRQSFTATICCDGPGPSVRPGRRQPQKPGFPETGASSALAGHGPAEPVSVHTSCIMASRGHSW